MPSKPEQLKEKHKMPASHHTIHVGLKKKGYDIVIGTNLLDQTDKGLADLIKNRQVVIICDEKVAVFHLGAVEKHAKTLAKSVHCVRVPAGEASKSFPVFEQVIADILALTIDRQTVILAFGGGVVGDLAGFVAACLLRGLSFIQMPTSLLAQVDSSVGGKTGINTAAGKNLVGAFHQPRLVLADIAFLKTLPLRELRAGYAEIVKYGLLGNAAFFEWLEQYGKNILEGDEQALIHAVQTSCQMKADIVAMDEFETGKRALLNLGHTFAHAFEAEAGYDGRLLHGEAVAAGLAMAFGFSRHLGLASRQDEMRVIAHLRALGLPACMADLPAGQASPQRLIQHMRKDKKSRDGNLTFILVESIGHAFVEHHVAEDQLHAFLERC